MYLIYIDESGKPNFNDPENFILSAVVIHESRWFILDKLIRKMKIRRFPQESIYFELHMGEIASSMGNYKGVDVPSKFSIAKELVSIIESANPFLISVVIDKKRITKKKKRNEEFVKKWAWNLMFERLEVLLKEMGDDFGFITMDAENEWEDRTIRRLLRIFKKEGSKHVQSTRLITEIGFTGSEYSNIIQVADAVCWAVRREYRRRNTVGKPNVKDRLARSMFTALRPLHFSSKKLGKQYGYKVFP